MEKESMLNVNSKNMKKSIYPKLTAKKDAWRMDIFLIIILVVLIACPVLINFIIKGNAENKQIYLYISPDFEEIFGRDLTETLLKDYLELKPGLLIKTDHDGKNSFVKGEPDILIFNDGGLNSLLADGLLLELESFPDTDNTFAVPLVSFMNLLFYNIDILTAAGLDRPPKTRDEFSAAAKAVLENTRFYGAAMALNPADRQSLSRDVFSWIWAAGGGFWSSEEKKPALDASSITADLSFLKSLYRDSLLAAGVFTATGEQRLDDFAGGRTAMMVASTQAIPYLREKMGDGAFGITTVPVPVSSGKYNIDISGIYAGINKNCEYQEEALDFLAFLAERRLLFCEIFKAVPGVVSDIIPGEYIRSDPFYSKAQDIFESSAITRGFSGIPRADEYENAFYEELRSFFETSRTPQETINAIQARWDKISGI